MKQVYFNLRTSSRERMWDTAWEASRVCQPLTPQVDQQTSVKRARTQGFLRPFLGRIKQLLFRILPLINYQHVTKIDDADLLYMWGAFPRGVKLPFVIELDNPFVLTYYRKLAFRLRRGALRKRLRKSKCIVHLSETARNHTLELFGSEFAEKSTVLSPFMEHNYRNNRRSDDGTVRFLFVGLGFRRKGGPELLEAFRRLPHKNARLTVVAPINETIKNRYANDDRITFFPPQSRGALFAKFYPAHDIFVFPSLLETLGVVILEALSFGMGIIATDLYATPEMVKDGQNGRLLPHPFLEPVQLNGVSTIDCVSQPRAAFERKYLQPEPLYEQLIEGIRSALSDAIGQKNVWQQQSVALFEERFSPEVWERRLTEIIR